MIRWREDQVQMISALNSGSLHGGSKLDDFVLRHSSHDFRKLRLRQCRGPDAKTKQVTRLRATRHRGLVGIKKFGDLRHAGLRSKADSHQRALSWSRSGLIAGELLGRAFDRDCRL